MNPADLTEAQRLSSTWKLGESLVRAGTKSAGTQQGTSTAATGKVGSGTVFIVSSDGHAITNQHVVNGCKELRLQGTDLALRLVTADAVNDLALLKLPEPESRSAPLSADPAKTRQGEDIVVFGFPLNSVLSSGGNLTPGVVSALTGLGNNTNQIQITAPVQPGSSGSPVLNKKGEVVAVVSQKISDVALVKATGAVGQNVSFAVNGQTLRSFLDANQVKYKSGAGFFAGEKSPADLADAARQWTHVVECWK
jgi:S1-C subfamily serine protease